MTCVQRVDNEVARGIVEDARKRAHRVIHHGAITAPTDGIQQPLDRYGIFRAGTHDAMSGFVVGDPLLLPRAFCHFGLLTRKGSVSHPYPGRLG